jgi:hypothetical protein
MIERFKHSDKKNAESIILASIRQMNYTLKLDSNDESAFNIIRNVYECFRMLGDALLVLRGLSSEDHVEQIIAIENLNLQTARPIRLIDSLRRMRHNINYYGFFPKKSEADDVISFAKSCFNQVVNAVKEEIKKDKSERRLSLS